LTSLNNPSPFISCYLNLEDGPDSCRETLDRPVEVVEHTDALMSLGGAGCLLRAQLDTRIDTQTAAAAASG
jgi:hypothetical protein